MDLSDDLFSDYSDFAISELLNKADELLSTVGAGLPSLESLNLARSNCPVPIIDLESTNNSSNIHTNIAQQESSDSDIAIVSATTSSNAIIDLCDINDTYCAQPPKQKCGKRKLAVTTLKNDSIIELNESIASPEKNIRFEDAPVFMQCPICLESAITNRPHTTICGHIFCEECIKKCLKIKKNCPSCKKALNISKIHPIYV